MALFDQLNVSQKKLVFLGAGFLLLIFLSKTIIVIPAGHVGVKEFFGDVDNQSLDAGIRIINPLANIHKMTIRTQQIAEEATVPSREGLSVSIDLSILFSLDPRSAPNVFKTIGLDYVTTVVNPQIRSVVRGVTAEYDAKALYTAEREVVAEKMFSQLKPALEQRGIRLEKVLLRAARLPAILSTAIEKKLEAEQQAEQMKFVLQREGQEAERKRIEAKGISDFNRIASDGLSDGILKLRGIEATQALVRSENAKVIVIGSGKDGLPIILGNQ
ncbi:MAG: prohibitin family protein [Deltaproteobacteria bacterium]|nr:prohibitin family protein [Deltaproteobacteria bacterium]